MHKTIVELAKEKRWKEIPKGNPALDEAVKLMELPLVEAITNNDYDLAFRRATFGKKWTMVRPLLPYLNNINSMSLKQKGQTALHFAARYGKDDVVTILLQNGAYPNIFDTENYDTPLHLACEFNHPSTAKILVEFGALNLLNRKQKSPMDYCIGFNYETKAKFSEFIFLSMAKEDGKNSLPPLPTKYDWLNRIDGKNKPLVILHWPDESKNRPEKDASKLPTLNHPEFKAFQIAPQTIRKTLDVITNHMISNISVENLISLEKKYNPMFSNAITVMLHHEARNCFLIDLTEVELQNYHKLSEKIILLEEQLNVEFEVVFKTSSHNTYFLKSKAAVKSGICEKLPAGSYSLSVANELLIGSDKIDQIIENNPNDTQFSLK